MTTSLSLPPGPPGKWLPTLKLIRNPRATLEGYRDRYGDPFLLNALNGPVVVTGRADLIREIHSMDPDQFDLFALQTIEPILGPSSIFSMTGARHRRERRLLSPMFQGERMRSYGPAMCQLARERGEACLASGRVTILPFMFDISFRLIVQNIFGGSGEAQMDALVQTSKSMIRGMHPLLFFTRVSHVKFMGFSPWDRFRRSRQRLYESLKELIRQRRSSHAEEDDTLSLLCKAKDDEGRLLQDEQVCDELVTFLFAGHETTALSLTWAMYHLHRHPAALEKLLVEIDGIADGDHAALASAPWLKACIQETLRLNPIVTETLRKLRLPGTLGEFQIPAGYGLAPATVLAHYDPSVWPEPDAFRPERFIDQDYSPFVYMPFGGGHRRCLGAAFAMQEMTMVLGTLLKHFEFRLVSDQPVATKRRNVTMGPSSPIPMTIARREDSRATYDGSPKPSPIAN